MSKENIIKDEKIIRKIKCKDITYAENGGTKILAAVAPNGYSFVYEVE